MARVTDAEVKTIIETTIDTTPFIDAGGKNAWDTMLRRTQTAFQRSHTLDIEENDKYNVAYSPPDGALSVLMDALSELYSQDSNYVFTLIGHSLGPVMINELIRRYPQLPYPNIVYMAPACSIRDAAATSPLGTPKCRGPMSPARRST